MWHDRALDGDAMPTPAPGRIAAVTMVLAALLAGCGQEQPKQAAPPPPTVTVAKPVQRSVVDYDEYVGRFVAIDSVEVRARVSGYLQKVHFQDGQIVKQGDLLFTIDPRPFQNALDQARANLAAARANLAYAEADLARGQQLVRDKTITEQIYQQRMQAKRTAEATVAAQEAVVRQAELDLEFSELRAPISGRIGDRRVSPGNLVAGGAQGSQTGSTTQPSTTLLATIVSTDPIRFEFTFDEASYLRYERTEKSGKDMSSREGGLPVALKLIDEKDFIHPGRMDFIDNVIDRTSGTIRGRAVFKNAEGLLTPGMFGRVRVPGSPSYVALGVPDTAIGTEQARKYVLVADAENIARQKYVTLGQVVDGLRVIKDGLQADDRVIVNGLMQVRAGQKVTPQEQNAAPPPASASAAQPRTN
jgi:RND family efflux transporter MFP subunit